MSGGHGWTMTSWMESTAMPMGLLHMDPVWSVPARVGFASCESYIYKQE